MLIFIDLDGTLVDYNIGEVTPKTKEALIQVIEAGHKVFLNTERPAFRLVNLDLSLFDGYICYSGGLIVVDKKILFHAFINIDILEQIVPISDEFATDLAFMEIKSAYYSGKTLEYLAGMPDGHEKGKKIEGSTTNFNLYKTDKIYKAGLYCKNDNDVELFRKKLCNTCTITFGEKVSKRGIY